MFSSSKTFKVSCLVWKYHRNFWINTGSGWWWWWMLILGKWLILSWQVLNSMSGAKQSRNLLLYIAPSVCNAGSARGVYQLPSWATAGKNLKQQSEAPGAQAKPVFGKGRPHWTWKALQHLAFLSRKPFTSILSETQQTEVYPVSYDMAARDGPSVCVSLLGAGAAD